MILTPDIISSGISSCLVGPYSVSNYFSSELHLFTLVLFRSQQLLCGGLEKYLWDLLCILIVQLIFKAMEASRGKRDHSFAFLLSSFENKLLTSGLNQSYQFWFRTEEKQKNTQSCVLFAINIGLYRLNLENKRKQNTILCSVCYKYRFVPAYTDSILEFIRYTNCIDMYVNY